MEPGEDLPLYTMIDLNMQSEYDPAWLTRRKNQSMEICNIIALYMNDYLVFTNKSILVFS